MKINKFLILFFAVFLFFSIFTVNSYAYTYEDYQFDNIDKVKEYTYQRKIVFGEGGSNKLHCFIFASNSEDIITIKSSSLFYFYKVDGLTTNMFMCPTNFIYKMFYFTYSGLGLTNPSSYEMTPQHETTSFSISNGYLKNIYYSDLDIYNSDGTLFFQKTPVTEENQTVLTPILEKVEMKESIVTTIVGLAKLLIPLLICLIGFWKAWHLLSRILHKA